MGWLLAAFVLFVALMALGKRWLGDGSHNAGTADPPPASPDDFDQEYDLHIGDELDLHGVNPREVGEWVDAFIDDAHIRGRTHVRIIHGKGIGVMRARVRARLERHAAVRAFGDAPPPSAWGATVVELHGRTVDVEEDPASD